MLILQPRWLLSSLPVSTPNVLLSRHLPPTEKPPITTTRHKGTRDLSHQTFSSLEVDRVMGKKTKITRGSGGRTNQSSSGTGGSSHGHRSNGSGGQRKPTHFLCFPIASDTAISQIAASLTHWMDVTTRPVSKAPHRRPIIHSKPSGAPEVIGEFDAEAMSKADSNQAGSKDSVTPNNNRPTRETLAESLKILPPIVTRAPGTWHLTLGVMDLADEARMKLALDVLSGLNLQRLLGEAERGPPVGYKPGRKWEDSREADDSTKTGNNNNNAGIINTGTKSSETEAQLQVNEHPQTPPRLTISLTGLGAFPSLRNARVLWARPRQQLSRSSTANTTSTKNAHNNDNVNNRALLSDSARLYNFALHLIQPFRDAGLITETRSLALHATVANMRFAKTKWRGPAWRCDTVDAGGIARVWNRSEGIVVERDGNENAEGEEFLETNVEKDDEEGEEQDGEEDGDDEGTQGPDATKEFVWVSDVDVNRVAICKLGAVRHEDPVWREWYPPIEGGERLIFEE